MFETLFSDHLQISANDVTSEPECGTVTTQFIFLIPSTTRLHRFEANLVALTYIFNKIFILHGPPEKKTNLPPAAMFGAFCLIRLFSHYTWSPLTDFIIFINILEFPLI